MLRALGLCGIDDSTDIAHLQILSERFPWVEWGVLFRPDKEGQPRYASKKFVEQLSKENKEKGINMRLAAHLCGGRVNEVLKGEVKFVKILIDQGFRRVQVNATKINGVDTSNIKDWSKNLISCMKDTPEMEWILQANEETKDHVIDPILSQSDRPTNMSILFDASCGTGVLPTSFPEVPKDHSIKCGYAGGIGPKNINEVLTSLKMVIKDYPYNIWIDMESSLRSMVDGKDVFSLEKSFKCIQQVHDGKFVAVNTHIDNDGNKKSEKKGWGCPMRYIPYVIVGFAAGSIILKAFSAKRGDRI